MNITSIKITPIDGDKTKAFASITMDNEFVVTGLKVLTGKNGLWVGMPNRKSQDGEYHDIVFPCTKEAREQIMEEVLAKFYAQEIPKDKQFNSPEAKQAYNNTHRNAPSIDVSESDLPF